LSKIECTSLRLAHHEYLLYSSRDQEINLDDLVSAAVTVIVIAVVAFVMKKNSRLCGFAMVVILKSFEAIFRVKIIIPGLKLVLIGLMERNKLFSEAFRKNLEKLNAQITKHHVSASLLMLRIRVH